MVKYDVFDTMDMARKMGFAIKMTWGRNCTRDEHVKMALSMLVSAEPFGDRLRETLVK